MSPRASPAVAATLSFVLPGLGQLSSGAVLRGAVFALPAGAVFVALVALALGGPSQVADVVLRPEVLISVLVLNAALAAYHIVAIIDAYRVAGGPMRRGSATRFGPVVLAVLLTATLSVHGAVEAVGYQAYDAFRTIFPSDEPAGGWQIPEPSFDAEPTSASSGGSSPTIGSPAAPSPTTSPSVASPTASASSTPLLSPAPSRPGTAEPKPKWAHNGRLDLLLIGSDAGPDRWSLRTDTMIVLSIDTSTNRAALFGVPRNMVGVPLPPESAGAFKNGRFPGLLNALYVYAMGHPATFPGGEARGFRAVSGAVQELVGVRLDGVVVVNLAGFVRLIDAIGGLWIDVPKRLVDRAYPLEDGSGHVALDIRPGCQLLDGRMSLAYARSRRQDSDYGRMRRQQLVLVSLARQVEPLELVPRVPKLLRIAKKNLWTTIARSDVKGMAALAARVDVRHVKTVLFVPSRYPSHLTSSEITKIRRVVRTAFEGLKPAEAPSPAKRSDCP
jgi:LCP family protein required for cell wall assembly